MPVCSASFASESCQASTVRALYNVSASPAATPGNHGSLLSMNRLSCSETGSCNPVGWWAPSTPRLWKKNQVLENLSPMLSLRGSYCFEHPRWDSQNIRGWGLGRRESETEEKARARRNAKQLTTTSRVAGDGVTHLPLAVACPFDYTLRSPGTVPKPGDPSPT